MVTGDLRSEPLVHVVDQAPPAEGLQPLVDAAHAAAFAACEDEPGDRRDHGGP